MAASSFHWNHTRPILSAMSGPAELIQCRPSDGAGIRRLAGHLVLLGCTAALVRASLGSGWVLPAMLLHGVVVVSLFAPLHESIHRTAFRRRWLNDLVARAVAFAHFMPARSFRALHLTHHRFTQDPERDPELQTPKPTTLWAYVRHASGVGHWRARLTELLRHAAGRVEDPWIPSWERGRICAEARWHVGTYLAIGISAVAFGWTAPLTYWLIPALLGQPFLRLYLLAEHTGCPQVSDPLANTRTTLSCAPLRFLMWNMPYNAEHHTLPAVPFHALPALHRDLSGTLQRLAPGYTSFHRSYTASLRSRSTAPLRAG